MEQDFKGLDMKAVQKVFDAFTAGDIVETIVEMDDRDFNAIRHVVLDELEKSFNRPNERIKLVEALRINNMSAEDVQDLQMQLIGQINENLTGQVSGNKLDFLRQITGLITNAIADTDGVYKRTVAVPYQKTRPEIPEPTYPNSGQYAMMVYATEEFRVDPDKSYLMQTGLRFALPKGYAFDVKTPARLLTLTKLRIVPQIIGTYDRSELILIIENTEPRLVEGNDGEDNALYGRDYTVEKGSIIAELVLREVPTAVLYEVNNIDNLNDEIGEKE